MSPQHWERVRTLFHAALDLPTKERAAFLESKCADSCIRAEVETLLGNALHGQGLVDRPALDSGSDFAVGMETNATGPTVAMPPAQVGARVIGRYHLLQRIGEGGMGEVWLAEQKEPVQRRVALKLVKSGMNSRELLGRFESERQALALMNHSAISRVLDGGSTPEGAPYFVMEYVAGVPITRYCDDHRLTTQERLELFIRVCEGVQHAHHRAIIHRDLKPSNILVEEVDGRPAPKIIDFGVAKALTQNLSDGGILTRVGTLIGTPEYMSPEQATSSAEDIDTRSDIYSLGIIFYELLVGSPPLDFKGTPLPEFLRKLREEEPPKPSTRVQKQSREASSVQARKHRTEPSVLQKQLRGDLDAIALKALEKERSRRYNSPADFAADIRRYLNHEAVHAVPPSAAYRAGKFARRYRVALVAAMAFLLVMIVASAISVRQGLRANGEAEVASAINNFLQYDLLAQANSDNQSSFGDTPDPDLKVRTALDRAAARIARKFNGHPEVEAAIRRTIGITYSTLGVYPEARSQIQRSLDLYRRIQGPNGQNTLDVMNDLASVIAQQADYAGAQALLSESLREARRLLGPEHEVTLHAALELGQIRVNLGHPQDAEPLIKKIVEVDNRVRGLDDPVTIDHTLLLANTYNGEGRKSEAETTMVALATVTRRRFGSSHPLTLRILNSLGQLYSDLRKYDRAEAIAKEAAEGTRRAFGPEHPRTLAAMTGLANVYRDERRYTEAETLHRQLLDVKRRVLGPDNRQTVNSLNYLVSTYELEGKFAESFPYAEEALAVSRRTYGPDVRFTMDAAAHLALSYLGLGKFNAAEPLAREALDWDRKNRADRFSKFLSESLLGASLAGQKKYGEALPLLLEGYQGMVAHKEQTGSSTPIANFLAEIDLASRWIDDLYRAWGKPDQVANWKQNLVSPSK